MFSDVVMGVEKRLFENIIDEMKEARGVHYDTELTADDLKELVVKFKDLYKKEMKKDFPQDPKEQLVEAITAVFRSWDNPRAIVYRRLNDIPGEWGTAVNVQDLVTREILLEQVLLFQEIQLQVKKEYMVNI